MRIVNLQGGKQFTIRQSIKELPTNRFTDFQKYLIQAAGIGSSMSDVDHHFKTLDEFLRLGKLEEAQRERYNLHFNLYLAINKISIRHICFGVLIDSVNGTTITDYSEDNLTKLVDDLGVMGLTEEMVSDILETVKKNSILS